jgi:DivIVA domain-containing protein
MPILPEDIATVTFSRVNRHGYNPNEVEAFLRKVSIDYGAALEKMFLKSDTNDDLDVGDEVNTILRTTRESANALLRRTQDQAQTIHTAAVEQAQDLDNKAAAGRLRAFEKSTNEANQVKEDSDKYAFELRSRTERESRQMVSKAEERTQHLQAYQQQLGQHLGEIERIVDTLRSEIDISGQGMTVPEQPEMEFVAPRATPEPAAATTPAGVTPAVDTAVPTSPSTPTKDPFFVGASSNGAGA